MKKVSLVRLNTLDLELFLSNSGRQNVLGQGCMFKNRTPRVVGFQVKKLFVPKLLKLIYGKNQNVS